MVGRTFGEEYRTTLVCVDGYENGILKGRFYNPYMEAEGRFESLMQFLQGMETTLEKMDFPKSFTATRIFAPLPPVTSNPLLEESRSGRVATFAIKILFRQNASWQGALVWLEGKREQSFRSVLELLLLMSSAMELTEVQQENESEECEYWRK